MAEMNGTERLRKIAEALKHKDMKTVREISGYRAPRIRELLQKLNDGSKYLAENPEKRELIEQRAKPIIDELIELGMDKDTPLRALHLSINIDDALEDMGY